MLQNEGFQHIYHKISSPWLKRFLNFDDLKYTRMKHFKTFITEYLHHGWKKIGILTISNAPEWRISTHLSQNIFTMVEEIFEFWLSEIHQNEEFQNRFESKRYFLPQWAFMDHIETQHRFYCEFKCHYTLFLIRNWL